MSELPPGVARHFVGQPIDLETPADRALLVERLLEDGDRRDLAWLGATIPRDEIAAWFDRRGGHRLSRRSRVFWAAALERPIPETHSLAEALWPLA